MTKSLKLNPELLNPPTHEKVRGFDIEVMLSPYDVPESVTGDFDPVTQQLVIEFKYITADEPREVAEREEFVTIFVGKNSGRLYRIEIDLQRLKPNLAGAELVAKLDAAIDKLSKLQPRRSRSGNYKLAKEIISKRGTELFEALAAS